MHMLNDLSGTPALTKPQTDEPYTADETITRRRSTQGDQSMRRTVQDLASSVDPNLKIDGEVEDVCCICLRSNQ
jgi:transcription initiation factor TFIID subunit 12